VILDATATDRSTAAGKRALVDVMFAAGCDVEHLTTPAAITGRLFALAEQVHSRTLPGRVVLVGIGLHALPGTKDSAEDRIETPADALDEILRDGPAAGVVTFAWWNRLHVITDHLGYRRANVNAYVFLRHPADGVRQATGLPLLKWDSQPARALVWDGIGVESTHVVPFAAPDRTGRDRSGRAPATGPRRCRGWGRGVVNQPANPWNQLPQPNVSGAPNQQAGLGQGLAGCPGQVGGRLETAVAVQHDDGEACVAHLQYHVPRAERGVREDDGRRQVEDRLPTELVAVARDDRPVGDLREARRDVPTDDMVAQAELEHDLRERAVQ
jgi:hypothetical protein